MVLTREPKPCYQKPISSFMWWMMKARLKTGQPMPRGIPPWDWVGLVAPQWKQLLQSDKGKLRLDLLQNDVPSNAKWQMMCAFSYGTRVPCTDKQLANADPNIRLTSLRNKRFAEQGRFSFESHHTLYYRGLPLNHMSQDLLISPKSKCVFIGFENLNVISSGKYKPY